MRPLLSSTANAAITLAVRSVAYRNRPSGVGRCSWADGVSSTVDPDPPWIQWRCRPSRCGGLNVIMAKYATLSEPSFRCSERYLDVKRSVRRGTCPPGTHTFDILLRA